MNNTIKNCCASPMKFYTASNSCRLCWECQNCRTNSCDKIMYTSSFLETEFLETNFLKGYGVTDSTRRYERLGSGANPDSLKPTKRGPDCSVVIMKLHERVKVYVNDPVNPYVSCDDSSVIKTMYRQWNMGRSIWTCRIGPQKKPLIATITIDNKKIPLIVTE